MKKILSVFLALMLLCGSAFAETTKTDTTDTTSKVITIDTSNAPTIPEGTLSASIVSFTGNQTYAVYSAPDSKSIVFLSAADKLEVYALFYIVIK